VAGAVGWRWLGTRLVALGRAHLDAAIALLAQRYPVGRHPKWGFNYRAPGTAELAAEDGIDLESIAADAIAAG